MQITLPFFAFASLNSMPYVHHPKQDDKAALSLQQTFNDELNYLIPNVPPHAIETAVADNTGMDTDR